MFFIEEDVAPAVQVATELFGPVGNMMEGKNVLKNITIGTFQFGKIWYGDIEGDTDYILSLCSVLTQRTGYQSFVVGENF
tara:strand:+ start:438 stop:677 length:240 start_codon:yes stop_codon:yes gene_type:complete